MLKVIGDNILIEVIRPTVRKIGTMELEMPSISHGLRADQLATYDSTVDFGTVISMSATSNIKSNLYEGDTVVFPKYLGRKVYGTPYVVLPYYSVRAKLE